MIIDLDVMVEQMAERIVALNNATPKLPSKEDIAWALTEIAVNHCFGGPLPEAPREANKPKVVVCDPDQMPPRARNYTIAEALMDAGPDTVIFVDTKGRVALPEAPAPSAHPEQGRSYWWEKNALYHRLRDKKDPHWSDAEDRKE